MKKILVIDDEADFVTLVAIRLQKAGYAVSFASEGNAGLAKAKAEKPDLILLDVLMPGLTGLETLRQLRGDPETRRIPVVMLSAKGDTDFILKAQELGCSDYLTKPFDDKELLATIERYRLA